MQYCQKNPNMLENITHLVFPQIAKANLVRQQLQRERRQGHFPPPLPVLLVQERVWV